MENKFSPLRNVKNVKRLQTFEGVVCPGDIQVSFTVLILLDKVLIVWFLCRSSIDKQKLIFYYFFVALLQTHFQLFLEKSELKKVMYKYVVNFNYFNCANDLVHFQHLGENSRYSYHYYQYRIKSNFCYF